MSQTIFELNGNFSSINFEGPIPPVGSKIYIRLEEHYHSSTECEVVRVDYGIMQFAFNPKLDIKVGVNPNGETEYKDVQRNHMNAEIIVKICDMEKFKINEKNKKVT